MAYTTIDNPELHFQTKLFTGTGSGTQAVTLDGSENMQPDWVWTKDREANSSHDLYDSVRGVGKRIRSDAGSVEYTNSDMLSSFNTDGFTVGTQDGVQYGTNDGVAWCWKAGTSFSNSGGSNGADLASSGSYNRDAGFSIVTFTGNATANQQIYHGINSVPKWMLLKNRTNSNAESWSIYHQSIGNTKKITLDTTATPATSNEFWEDTTPTSTVLTVGRQDAVNGNGNTHVVYCFSEVKGYSKFGSYTGNGNADGPFVYLGFRPAFIMQKRTDSSSNWTMVDNKRDVDNIVNTQVIANGSGAEFSENVFDFLSNGFKIKAVHGGYLNASGGTYIYMAFAESPFVNSNGVPNNAR